MAFMQGGNLYSRRPVPSDLKALPAWLITEVGNLMRGLTPASHRTVTADTTVLITDGLILCDATTAPLTVTWPSPIRATEDWVITIKKTDASANAVTIAGTVDGAANPTLAAQYDSLTVWSDGTTLHKLCSV